MIYIASIYYVVRYAFCNINALMVNYPCFLLFHL